MAIPNAPIEQRLDEIVPPPQQREVSAEPDEPIPAFEPAHTGDDNVVQVAGLRNIIICKLDTTTTSPRIFSCPKCSWCSYTVRDFLLSPSPSVFVREISWSQ